MAAESTDGQRGVLVVAQDPAARDGLFNTPPAPSLRNTSRPGFLAEFSPPLAFRGPVRGVDKQGRMTQAHEIYSLLLQLYYPSSAHGFTELRGLKSQGLTEGG